MTHDTRARTPTHRWPQGYNAAGGRARRHGAAAAVAAAQDLFTKKREESVEQQLPRLAYLLSDVIIFVDVVDAANKDVRLRYLHSRTQHACPA